ncbi:MAG: metallophosphoesterase [Clostridiales bacterium]|nr:metallophosphoesterase [Clostridiales bacterium]
MSIFSISDIHLPASGKSEKSMDIFGERWRSHREKIKNNWKRVVSDDDTVILPGDISWALTLDEARNDFVFINSLPGKKIIGKGNHDFWWTSLSKMNAALAEWECGSIRFLRGGMEMVENAAVAMTCGKFPSEGESETDFLRLSKREATRLDTALTAANEKSDCGRAIVFLHYPVYYMGAVNEPIFDVICSHGVTEVYYGHIHGGYGVPAVTEYRGVRFHLVSADYLGFCPTLVRT